MANLVLRNDAVNTINVVGILAEKNLEITTYKDGKTGEVKDCIRGDISVKTGSNSFIKFKVFSNRLTKDGSESKGYKAFQTIIGEYVSIADCGNEETADKIEVMGKLNMNKPFMGKDGKVVSNLEYSCNFCSRVRDKDMYQASTLLDAEVFIQGYVPEQKIVEGEVEQTGRIIAKLVLPVYGGKIIPFDGIIESDQAKDFFEDVEKGTSLRITCDLRNRTEKTQPKATTNDGGFGVVPQDRVFTNYINEIILIGAARPYAEYDEEVQDEMQKAFNPKAITQAIQVFKATLEEAKEEKPKTSTPQTGFAQSDKPKTSGGGMKFDSSGDLPF